MLSFHFKLSRRLGYSLVETLVALCLSGILMLAIVQSYALYKKFYLRQVGFSRIQESSLFSHYLLKQKVHSAGSFGCASFRSPVNTVMTTKQMETLWGSSAFEVFNLSENLAIARRIKGKALPEQPALWIKGIGFSQAATQIDLDKGELYVSDPSSFKAGRHFVLADCSYLLLLEIVGDPVYTSNGNALISFKSIHLPVKHVFKQPIIAKLQSLVYYIGESGRKNGHGESISSLYETDLNGVSQEMVEGIESWTLKKDIDSRLLITMRFNSVDGVLPQLGLHGDHRLHKEYVFVLSGRS